MGSVSSADRMSGGANAGTVEQSSTATRNEGGPTDTKSDIARKPVIVSVCPGTHLTNFDRRWCYDTTEDTCYGSECNEGLISVELERRNWKLQGIAERHNNNKGE